MYVYQCLIIFTSLCQNFFLCFIIFFLSTLCAKHKHRRNERIEHIRTGKIFEIYVNYVILENLRRGRLLYFCIIQCNGITNIWKLEPLNHHFQSTQIYIHTEVDKCHLFSILHRVYGALKTDSLLPHICFLSIVVVLFVHIYRSQRIPMPLSKRLRCSWKIGITILKSCISELLITLQTTNQAV